MHTGAVAAVLDPSPAEATGVAATAGTAAGSASLATAAAAAAAMEAAAIAAAAAAGASHRRMLWSREEEARILPAGLNATQYTCVSNKVMTEFKL